MESTIDTRKLWNKTKQSRSHKTRKTDTDFSAKAKLVAEMTNRPPLGKLLHPNYKPFEFTKC